MDGVDGVGVVMLVKKVTFWYWGIDILAKGLKFW